MNKTQIDNAVADTRNHLDLLHRVALDEHQRFEEARLAGVTFAAVVGRFLADPEGVGTDAVADAYVAFMERHSANFGPVTVDA